MARTVRLLTPHRHRFPRWERWAGAAAWAVALGLCLSTAAQAFELGHSGIHVERTPQSLLVTQLDSNSPAALAHLPSVDGRIMRVLYINGVSVRELDEKGELASAFRARSVLVTLGVRDRDDADEHLEGPFVLDLVDSPQNRLRRFIASRQWLKVASLASSGQLRPEETEATWARVALEAIHYSRSGQWDRAFELGDTIPLSDPAYRTVAAQLPSWRVAAKAVLQEDRRVLSREVVHAGPNPRRIVAKKVRDRQGARPRKNRDS